MIRIGPVSFNLSENVGTQIFSLETIQDSNLFKSSQTVTAIDAFPHKAQFICYMIKRAYLCISQFQA